MLTKGITTTETIYTLGLKADTFLTIMSQRKSGKSVLISTMIHHFMTNQDENERTAAINDKTNHSYKFLDKRAILQPDPNRH